jgi:dTDP-4-dehydrorhamnose 3,5-epimerase
MKQTLTAIEGVFTVDTQTIVDHRGGFARMYCDSDLAFMIGQRRIVQINHSRTARIGAVRGMHFQFPPHAEMKFIRCIKGRVWDVAVDLRADSPTFLHWHAEELSAQNARMLIIPEGCAHGFQVLEHDSELLYLHTAPYVLASEGGVPYDDVRLAIPWPLPAQDLSSRDLQHPRIGTNFSGIRL